MNIVITMGGMGSRFQKAGYNQPKYMIVVKNKTLFEWSVMSLSSFAHLMPKYIFIVKEADGADEFIESKCKILGIENYSISHLQNVTDGQATTVLYAKSYCKYDEPILIYNIDTFIQPEYLLPEIDGDGWIPCFSAPGESWSFVKLDDEGNAIEVREKKRISSNATIGLYWFSSFELYENMYLKYYSDTKNMEKGEKYVAPLYNQMISDGYKVRIMSIPSKAVHVLGTPEEVKVFESTYIDQ